MKHANINSRLHSLLQGIKTTAR